jgi:hypothetical protein
VVCGGFDRTAIENDERQQSEIRKTANIKPSIFQQLLPFVLSPEPVEGSKDEWRQLPNISSVHGSTSSPRREDMLQYLILPFA